MTGEGPRAPDAVVPFQVESGAARGRVVRLGPAFARILAVRDYPEAVAVLLGEAVALAAVLASGLKYDGAFTLQAQGDGPVGLLVVELSSAGDLRATARFDATRLAAPTPGRAPVPALLGAGHLAFTVDQGPDTERYQGITELDGATLSDCAHGYFRRSEQMETAIVLAAGRAGDGTPVAGGLMAQRLPTAGLDETAADESWRRAVAFASSVRTAELLDPGLDPARLLYRLYHEDGVRVFAERPLRFHCRCSRERVGALLRSFGEDEIAAMMEDGRIAVTCDYCGETQLFDAAALAALRDA